MGKQKCSMSYEAEEPQPEPAEEPEPAVEDCEDADNKATCQDMDGCMWKNKECKECVWKSGKCFEADDFDDKDDDKDEGDDEKAEPETCAALKRWSDAKCMEKCGDSRNKCSKKCAKYCSSACQCNGCYDDQSWKVTHPKRFSNRGGCMWVAEDFQ